MDNVMRDIIHEAAVYKVVLENLMNDCILEDRDAKIAVYHARYLLGKLFDKTPEWLEKFDSYDVFANNCASWEYISEEERKDIINKSKEAAF